MQNKGFAAPAQLPGDRQSCGPVGRDRAGGRRSVPQEGTCNPNRGDSEKGKSKKG